MATGFPTDPQTFDADERISFSKLDNKFLLVQDDGTEYEFDDALKRWIPAVDEALLEAQGAAYRVAGVDESEPVDIAARRGKRKVEYVNGQDEDAMYRAKAPRRSKPAGPPKANTAVYVTGLPHDATVEEVAEVFSRKCGVIAEEIDSGKPRIKLYIDEQGSFKGDALVVFFKAPSVDMAIMLLDDSEFRFGQTASGRIRVQAADASYKKVQQPGAEAPNENGNNSATAARSEGPRDRTTKTSNKDKQKIIKKTQKLDARLADWSDDEPSSITEMNSRWDKVVILKHMFTLQELAEDPAAILDIKEDIRDECSKLGEVTNVVLFDLEEDGVASVRFANAQAAMACVTMMDGRSFGGSEVEALIADGKEQYKKSKTKAVEEAD